MKSLSLAMTDTSLMKPADAASKSAMTSDGAAQAESNASFQMMLNKQVQAKHTSARELENKQNLIKQPKKTASSELSSITTKSEKVDTTTMQKSAQKASFLQPAKIVANHTKAINETESIEPQLDSSNLAALDVKSILPKEDVEVKAVNEDTALASASLIDKNLITDISNVQMLSFMMSEAKHATDTGVGSEMSTEKQLTLGAERGSALKDAVLSNVLSQGKSSSDTKDLSTVDDKSSRHDWIDAILPSVSKPINIDDAAKLELESEKESLNKEMTMLADFRTSSQLAGQSTTQSSMQANAAEVIWQSGSSNTINAYPGKSGWDQAISQKVVWMLGAQEQSATLTLNPPDMGPLQVVIHVHNDQADTTFISDNAEVRQALQDGMDHLREKMNASGIQLGQSNISSGEQMQQHFQQAMQQSKVDTPSDKRASTSQIEHTNSPKTLVRIANGLVDTFV